MRRRVPILIGAWGLFVATLAAADEIRVISLVRQGQVHVSFWLDGGLPPEMRESIRSGLETTITYDIELRKVRVRIDESRQQQAAGEVADLLARAERARQRAVFSAGDDVPVLDQQQPVVDEPDRRGGMGRVADEVEQTRADCGAGHAMPGSECCLPRLAAL